MGGGDKTVWTVIDEMGVIEQIVMDTPNTMEIVGRTKQLTGLLQSFKRHCKNRQVRV